MEEIKFNEAELLALFRAVKQRLVSCEQILSLKDTSGDHRAFWQAELRAQQEVHDKMQPTIAAIYRRDRKNGISRNKKTC